MLQDAQSEPNSAIDRLEAIMRSFGVEATKEHVYNVYLGTIGFDFLDWRIGLWWDKGDNELVIQLGPFWLTIGFWRC